MLWTQSLVSFAVWVAYGVLIWRRMRVKPRGLPANKAVGGPLLLLAGVGLLAVGFVAIEALGGLGPSGLTPLGWIAMTVFGIGFVHCQTVAAAWMAGAAYPGVTSGPAPASSKQDKEALP